MKSKPITPPINGVVHPPGKRVPNAEVKCLRRQLGMGVNLPKWERPDTVRVIPRATVHPAIVGEWYR